VKPWSHNIWIRGKRCHFKATAKFKVLRGENLMSMQSLRDNPRAIAAYLTEMFEKDDLSDILDGINLVMRAQNVKALAESIGLRRDGLYKTFGGRDPQLSKVLALFSGLDVRIVIKPLPPQQKTPRPKLGRPFKPTSC
jgi:probable addiction module antidote protein